MKKLMVFFAVLVLIGVGYFSYSKYEEYKLVSALTPHLKNTSIRLENALRSEIGSNITFAEMRSNIEASIAEIDKRIIEIQTIQTAGNREKITPALDYLKGSQEMLRSQLSFLRKRLDAVVAIDISDRARAEVFSSNLGIEYLLDRAKQTKIDSDNAISAMEVSRTEFLAEAKKWLTIREITSKSMPIDSLVDPSAMLDLIKKHEKKPSDEKSGNVDSSAK